MYYSTDKSFENFEKFLPVLSESISNDWSSWTECSQPCGGGSRFRKRIKPFLLRNTMDKLTKNDYEIEHELCNLQSCTGKVIGENIQFAIFHLQKEFV